jgi:signal transduction histidine kinase
MNARVEAHDWGATSLGPLSSWAPSLRAMVGLVLRWPSPAVLLCGPEGLVIYNDAYAGLSVEVHPRRLGASSLGADFGAALVRQALAGRSVSQRNHAFVVGAAVGGGIAHLDLDYAPVHDEGGSVVGAIGIITERRVTNEPPQASREEFLGLLAHELRTPLSAVVLWSRMLRGGLAPSDHAQAIAAIEEGALAQQRVIDDLLDFSQLAPGRLVLELTEVDPAEMLGRAVEALRVAAEAKGVSLRLVPPEAGPSLLMDADRIERVVWNLLHNAIRFTPAAGKVVLVAERRGEGLRIAISDNGRGVEAEVLPHIFAVHSARRSGGPPLGLGLALTRQLVELHGGTLVARSEGRGFGSTFTLELPALQPSARMVHAH